MLLRKILYFSIGLAAISLGACSDCTRGKGELLEEERLLPHFYTLNSQLAADIRIFPTTGRQGPGVVIRAQQNLMPLILAQVDNNSLTLSSASCYTFSEPVTIMVYADSLRAINQGGSGNVTSELLFDAQQTDVVLSGSGDISISCAAETINLEVSGSGNISASGSAGVANLSISGSGNLFAKNLLAKTVVGEINGSGNIHCYVNEMANFTLNGSGNILYYGNNSKVTKNQNGSREIRHIQ